MIPPYNGILLLDNKKIETLIHGTTWMNFENVRNKRNVLNTFIYKEKVLVAQSSCGIGWGGRIS